MGNIRIDEIDAVYLSYDEPQAELFWAELLAIVPWAKRVHGVKGFDAAHKACANLSRTERFLTIDGDNRVERRFFEMSLGIPEDEQFHTFSWGARNAINGLVYGNGGIKCWHRDTVLRMRSHEAGKTAGVDFCWDANYVQMKNSYSSTHPNGSPYQAFRAGFREGVKMLLDRGNPVPVIRLKNLWEGNIKRLEVWCSVGSDVDNGDWAILGAREGIVQSLTGIDFARIADYEWFEDFWSTMYDTYEGNVIERILQTEPMLKEIGLNVSYLSPEQSKFFKNKNVPLHPRSARVMERETDV